MRPHRAETFKLSSESAFVDKVRDVVGLYLAPPDRALVLCVDEKPQSQPAQQAPAPSLQGPMPGGIGGAAQGTAPSFPLRPGQAKRRTHDYRRHGTTDLFAALDVKAGTVIGTCERRHRSVEFCAFLDRVERGVPPGLEVHLVLDNLKTHKTRLIHDWLVKRPRFRLHFTPTSASPRRPPGLRPCGMDRVSADARWLNLVEGCFALLSRRRLERGAFTGTRDLEDAIHAYIAETNAHPKPFVWTKTADDILTSVARFRQRTSNSAQ